MQSLINTAPASSPNSACAIHGRAWNGAKLPAESAGFGWTAQLRGCRQTPLIEELRPSLLQPVHKEWNGAVHVRAAYTGEQEAIVKDTWSVLKKDAAHNAMVLFSTVFEIAPAAKKLFSFLKDSDVPVEKNPKLKKHALQVFTIICEAASSLTKKGQVSTPGSTMQDMAHAHAISGVVDEHYDVVKYSLLKTVQGGLPAHMWNDEVKNAWGDAYDELVLAIKAQEQYSAQA